MKRIEFLGAPGVGKSTIYKDLLKIKNRRWYAPAEVKLLYHQSRLKEYARSPVDYVRFAVRSLPVLKHWNFLVADKALQKEQRNVLWDQSDKLMPIFDIALESAFLKERNAVKRLYGLHLLYSTAQDVAFLESLKRPDIVFFNEGLAQKAYGIVEAKQNHFEDIVERYYQAMPLPVGLVFCDLDVEKTIYRLKKRKKAILGHRDINDEELVLQVQAQLSIAQLGAKILKDRGVKVLYINTQKEIQENVKIINEFTREIV